TQTENWGAKYWGRLDTGAALGTSFLFLLPVLCVLLGGPLRQLPVLGGQVQSSCALVIVRQGLVAGAVPRVVLERQPKPAQSFLGAAVMQAEHACLVIKLRVVRCLLHLPRQPIEAPQVGVKTLEDG